jgi:hypothetical protein
LRLADKVGSAEAGKHLGISSGTIRWWRHENGEVKPPTNADPIDWAERKEKGAAAAYSTAIQALAEIRKRLEAGDHRGAKDLAVTYGVLLDKHGMLREAAAREQGRNVELAEEQAHQLAGVVRRLLKALGVDISSAPIQKLIRSVFVDPGRADDYVPDDVVREARQDVLRQHGIRLDMEARQLEHGDGGPPGLPEQASDVAAGELTPPERVVRTFNEEQGVEIVDGEVVDVLPPPTWRTHRPARRRGFIVQGDGSLRAMTDDEWARHDRERAR